MVKSRGQICLFLMDFVLKSAGDRIAAFRLFLSSTAKKHPEPKRGRDVLAYTTQFDTVQRLNAEGCIH